MVDTKTKLEIRIPANLKQATEAAAVEQGVSITDLVTRILAEHLAVEVKDPVAQLQRDVEGLKKRLATAEEEIRGLDLDFKKRFIVGMKDG
ncbi:MAG: hypothetical protein F6K42_21200 [Leptolyngbya sp. SIO1D8]|nr:hypothetical protein [Leptolyngbya sp. SIO1D8]